MRLYVLSLLLGGWCSQLFSPHQLLISRLGLEARLANHSFREVGCSAESYTVAIVDTFLRSFNRYFPNTSTRLTKTPKPERDEGHRYSFGKIKPMLKLVRVCSASHEGHRLARWRELSRGRSHWGGWDGQWRKASKGRWYSNCVWRIGVAGVDQKSESRNILAFRKEEDWGWKTTH